MSNNVPQDSLAIPITKRLTTNDARRELLQDTWLPALSAQEYAIHASEFDIFFDHYNTISCNVSGNSLLAQLDHRQLVDCFQILISKALDECVATLIGIYDQFSDDAKKINAPNTPDFFVREWIKLTGKVLLLLDLTLWTENTPLKVYLSTKLFHPLQLTDTQRIPLSLNLRNLNLIGGLAVRWTDVMSEHLRLELENTQMAVFHHVQVVKMLESSPHRDIFPIGLLNEVSRLGGVLLPRYDPKSQDWFKSQIDKPDRRAAGSSHNLDPEFKSTMHLPPADRGLDRFPFFKDRLVAVREEYDNHEPLTIMQRLRDNRRPSRRYGFIIAVIIFVFGAAQTATGIVQVYKAYHPSNP